MAARLSALRRLSTAAEQGGERRARPRSVLTPEFGVMLGMSAWGVYCAMRVLRAKSQFASELLELEQALAGAQARADELAAENARLARGVREARGVLSTAGMLSAGSTARALRILG